ncbi:hypothetical protein EDB89DRAFT_2077804 [Lactarius sanguifluus]|nr:hypothetical protein EDB89DRAFT_2077804 [Lactarius sanguifluus]
MATDTEQGVDPSASLASHLDTHISATRHHFTGAPEPPEPPYAPSYHPPTGYWTGAEKALFFHALSTYSRFRPDLIASSIGTKSVLDVVVYLGLLCDGAQGITASRGAIARDQLPAAHEVSPALVALEDTHAADLAATEPSRADEACAAARTEAERTMRNSLRVRKGEGGSGAARDRAGQQARREELERWRAEQEGVWAREDTLARLDCVALQALDRMLRVDEERSVEAHFRGEGEAEEHGTPAALPGQPVAGLSTAVPPSRTTSPASEHLSTLDPCNRGDDSEEVDAVLANLSPASRRRARKRLYMRRKRAEACGGVAQLNPMRLKPGRKSSATNKSKQRRPSTPDPDDSDEGAEQKRRGRRPHGITRPYKVQRELDELGIDAEYMRENGLGLFRLGALWRLMRMYPRLDPLQPKGVTEFISAGTIQALHTLVVRFTRDIVRRALALRELDFARRGRVKMWRLGSRVVRPPHVRRALQTRGACLNKHTHFDGLLELFSEDDEESEEDVPLALLMRGRKRGKAAVREEEEEDSSGRSVDDGIWTDEDDEEDERPRGTASGARPRYSRHRETYAPFVYAPDLVAPAHPFGIYAPGTIPEPLGAISDGVRRRPAAVEYDSNSEQEEAEDLMPDATDDEALEVELAAETLVDTVDARAAAAYEARVWRELRGAPRPQRRIRKRAAQAGVEDERAQPMRPRKRRKVLRSGPADALQSPDGVKVKSAAMIEDSDSDDEYVG